MFKEGIENFWKDLHNDIFDSGKVEYLGSQLEKCPNTGRPHWQAYIRFFRQYKQRGTWFKRFCNGIHFEKCSKERAEAINYGTKEDTRLDGPLESGTKPMPTLSTKQDYDKLKELILLDKKDEVDFKHVLIRNLEKRWEALQEFYKKDLRQPLPDDIPNPWGLNLKSTGLGKKKHYWIYSREPNKGKSFYFAKPLTENYLGEIVCGDLNYYSIKGKEQFLIFDEYNITKIKWADLNSMCDGTFGYRVIYKGNMKLKDPIIFILSNKSMSDLYNGDGLMYLNERFNEYELY